MGHSSEVSGSLNQLKRQGAIVSAGRVHISFQKVQRPLFCRATWACHGLDHLWNHLQSTAESWMGFVSQVETFQDGQRLGKEAKVKELKGKTYILTM